MRITVRRWSIERSPTRVPAGVLAEVTVGAVVEGCPEVVGWGCDEGACLPRQLRPRVAEFGAPHVVLAERGFLDLGISGTACNPQVI